MLKPIAALDVMWFHATIARTRSYLAPLIVAGALAGLADAAAAQGDDDTVSPNTASGAIQDILLPSKDAPQASGKNVVWTELRAFYEARDFAPAWSGSKGALENMVSARSALEHAYQQGLENRVYLAGIARWKAAPEPGEDAARFDVAMTEALLHYAMDVRVGHVDPKSVYKEFGLPRQDYDAAAALIEALEDDSLEDFLSDLPPHNTEYQELVLALARYRAIAAKGGWPAVSGSDEIGTGKDGKPTALARRLAFEDTQLAQSPKPSNDEIHEAVLRFQRKNGLAATGKIDAETLRALNVSPAARVLQITANLERWRWMPRKLEDRYIVVNIPDQSVDFIDDGTSKLHSRVIIGRRDQPTPIMRTAVEAIVANPSWEIPDDIAAKEILPHLRKNPNYLATRNMVLAGGPADDPHGTKLNWKRVAANNLPYQIEQSPGPDSVLGTVMLDSPNDFGVYMHGTSNKKLFESGVREISHGCVRVEDVFALAMLAMGQDVGYGGDSDLKAAIDSHQTQRLPLSDPVPAYMLYWTAFVDDDGTVEFRPDRYDRDPPLIARLVSARSRPSKRASQT